MKTPTPKGGVGNRSFINVNDDYELKYWVQVFDVTEAQLTSAVKAVGTNSDEVSKYIRSKHKHDPASLA
jgi:hypothetical protein